MVQTVITDKKLVLPLFQTSAAYDDRFAPVELLAASIADGESHYLAPFLNTPRAEPTARDIRELGRRKNNSQKKI